MGARPWVLGAAVGATVPRPCRDRDRGYWALPMEMGAVVGVTVV